MFEAFVGVLVGFAFGYGVREIISRRRRAAARNWAQFNQPRSRQAQIDRFKVVTFSRSLPPKQNGKPINLH
jgi:hypothetical protein